MLFFQTSARRACSHRHRFSAQSFWERSHHVQLAVEIQPGKLYDCDPEETVLTAHKNPKHGRRVEVLSSVSFSSRLNAYWYDAQLPLATLRVKRLIKALRPAVVVGAFPYYHLLHITRQACRETQTPWVAYLHDTLSEALSTGRLSDKAARLHDQVFAEASAILVMSAGMERLYQKKYGLTCTVLQHSLPEPVPASLPENDSAAPPAFWGGGIYEINGHALGRVSEALGQLGRSLFLASTASLPVLNSYGITGDHVKRSFYAEREAYLAALRAQGLLVLALDWPDESPVHPEELATIFPTKTPEYLASGRPVLVHCPEDYFLAQFFLQHRCGWSSQNVQYRQSPRLARRFGRAVLKSNACGGLPWTQHASSA